MLPRLIKDKYTMPFELFTFYISYTPDTNLLPLGLQFSQITDTYGKKDVEKDEDTLAQLATSVQCHGQRYTQEVRNTVWCPVKRIAYVQTSKCLQYVWGKSGNG